MPLSTPAADTPVRPSLRPPMIAHTYGEPRFHTAADVAALAFTPDGGVRSVDDAGHLCHWSADGRLVSQATLSDLETVWAFSPCSRFLASATEQVQLWDAATGRALNLFSGDAWVTALGFAPGGGTLVSGHDDGKITMWETANFTQVSQFDAHPGAVSALAVSPDGTKLATAGEDRSVRVWELATQTQLAEFKSHTDRVPAIAWANDNQTLVSAGWDTSARVWRLGTPDPLILLNSHADQVVGATFAATGVLATADSDNDIHIWANPVSGKATRVLRGHADEIRALAFSADGKLLASGGADRVIHVWDAATGDLVAGPAPANRHSICVFPVGDKVHLASVAAGLRVWDAATGEVVAPSDPRHAAAVAASPDGHVLAVGGTDIYTRLYRDGGEPVMLEATKPPVGAVAVSPNAEFVAHTSPVDGLAWIWDVQTAQPRLILIGAADGCTLETIAVHPDNNRVAVGGIDYLSTGERDGAVCIWDLSTQENLVTFDTGVHAIAFDPSGRYLAGAGITDTVHVWDLSTQESIFALEGHQDKVNALAFSPDGSFLLSASDDQTVRVWDILSGRLIVAREFDAPVQSICFAPDGKSLFTGNGNTTCYRVDFALLLDETL